MTNTLTVCERGEVEETPQLCGRKHSLRKLYKEICFRFALVADKRGPEYEHHHQMREGRSPQ